jgi:hypothetical protein
MSKTAISSNDLVVFFHWSCLIILLICFILNGYFESCKKKEKKQNSNSEFLSILLNSIFASIIFGIILLFLSFQWRTYFATTNAAVAASAVAAAEVDSNHANTEEEPSSISMSMHTPSSEYDDNSDPRISIQTANDKGKGKEPLERNVQQLQSIFGAFTIHDNQQIQRRKQQMQFAIVKIPPESFPNIDVDMINKWEKFSIPKDFSEYETVGKIKHYLGNDYKNTIEQIKTQRDQLLKIQEEIEQAKLELLVPVGRVKENTKKLQQVGNELPHFICPKTNKQMLDELRTKAINDIRQNIQKITPIHPLEIGKTNNGMTISMQYKNEDIKFESNFANYDPQNKENDYNVAIREVNEQLRSIRGIFINLDQVDIEWIDKQGSLRLWEWLNLQKKEITIPTSLSSSNWKRAVLNVLEFFIKNYINPLKTILHAIETNWQVTEKNNDVKDFFRQYLIFSYMLANDNQTRRNVLEMSNLFLTKWYPSYHTIITSCREIENYDSQLANQITDSIICSSSSINSNDMILNNLEWIQGCIAKVNGLSLFTVGMFQQIKDLTKFIKDDQFEITQQKQTQETLQSKFHTVHEAFQKSNNKKEKIEQQYKTDLTSLKAALKQKKNELSAKFNNMQNTENVNGLVCMYASQVLHQKWMNENEIENDIFILIQNISQLQQWDREIQILKSIIDPFIHQLGDSFKTILNEFLSNHTNWFWNDVKGIINVKDFKIFCNLFVQYAQLWTEMNASEGNAKQDTYYINGKIMLHLQNDFVTRLNQQTTMETANDFLQESAGSLASIREKEITTQNALKKFYNELNDKISLYLEWSILTKGLIEENQFIQNPEQFRYNAELWIENYENFKNNVQNTEKEYGNDTLFVPFLYLVQTMGEKFWQRDAETFQQERDAMYNTLFGFIPGQGNLAKDNVPDSANVINLLQEKMNTLKQQWKKKIIEPLQEKITQEYNSTKTELERLLANLHELIDASKNQKGFYQKSSTQHLNLQSHIKDTLQPLYDEGEQLLKNNYQDQLKNSTDSIAQISQNIQQLWKENEKQNEEFNEWKTKCDQNFRNHEEVVRRINVNIQERKQILSSTINAKRIEIRPLLHTFATIDENETNNLLKRLEHDVFRNLLLPLQNPKERNGTYYLITLPAEINKKSEEFKHEIYQTFLTICNNRVQELLNILNLNLNSYNINKTIFQSAVAIKNGCLEWQQEIRNNPNNYANLITLAMSRLPITTENFEAAKAKFEKIPNETKQIFDEEVRNLFAKAPTCILNFSNSEELQYENAITTAKESNGGGILLHEIY